MSAAKPPNLLFIIMDDLAWGDLGRHGNPVVQTPHLDRLHDQAARLTRYCTGPLCSPARASVMTGRYHYRTGVVDTYIGRSTMRPDERTLAHVLRDAGYATGIFGKWHLGDRYPARAMDMGFDTANTHGGGGIGQFGDHPGNTYFDPVLDHNGRPTPRRGYCTDLFFDDAIDFIRQHRDQPWFAYVGTNCPHTPLQVPDDWVEPYRKQGVPESHARVYAMVENIDANVGRALAQLDELGLAEDTIVVFTSDHGPCGSANHNGQPRYNADLRGMKGTLYEGGIKVPCLLRWPARFRPGREVDRIASPIDWLPTFAAACGADLPSDRTIDGVNLLPLLTDETADEDWPERLIFMQWHRGDVPQRGRNSAAIGQRYKCYRPENGGDELYDLVNDPHEQHDLAADDPDRVAAMRRAYDAWFDDVASEHGDETFAPIRIVLGSAAEARSYLNRQDWRLYPPARDGWGTDLPGCWPVHIQQAGAYRVELHTPPDAPGQAVLHLRCGGCTVERELDRLEAVYVFERLDLPAGDQTFEAYLEQDGQRFGVLHAWVERADA